MQLGYRARFLRNHGSQFLFLGYRATSSSNFEPFQKVNFAQFPWRNRSFLDLYRNAAFGISSFWAPYVPAEWMESGF